MKEFFRPTFKKIILTLGIFILILIILGIPVDIQPQCKLSDPYLPDSCPRHINFIEFQQFFTNERLGELIGNGIWLLPWHIYIIELIISYFVASATVSLLYKPRK